MSPHWDKTKLISAWFISLRGCKIFNLYPNFRITETEDWVEVTLVRRDYTSGWRSHSTCYNLPYGRNCVSSLRKDFLDCDWTIPVGATQNCVTLRRNIQDTEGIYQDIYRYIPVCLLYYLNWMIHCQVCQVPRFHNGSGRSSHQARVKEGLVIMVHKMKQKWFHFWWHMTWKSRIIKK